MQPVTFLLALLLHDPALNRAAEDLSSDRYAVRLAAAKSLEKAGPRALPTLALVQWTGGLDARTKAAALSAKYATEYERLLPDNEPYYPWIDSLDPRRFGGFKSVQPGLLCPKGMEGKTNAWVVDHYLHHDPRLKELGATAWPTWWHYRSATAHYVTDLLASGHSRKAVRALLVEMFLWDREQEVYYKVPRGPDT